MKSLNIEEIKKDTRDITEELIELGNLKEGNILVVGCSTSEIMGDKIGTNSNFDVAEIVFKEIYDVLKNKGIYLATQCCEHLNRAIVIEREAYKGDEIVNVIPQKKAGGSFSTNAYKYFNDPVVVEHIKADGGMDIGDTFIGMHLKEVAVPLRLSKKEIGNAHLSACRVRPKFIGGERAVYNKDLM